MAPPSPPGEFPSETLRGSRRQVIYGRGCGWLGRTPGGGEGVPLAGEDSVDGGVGPGTVAAFYLAFVEDGLGEVSGEEEVLASQEGSLDVWHRGVV